MLERRDIAPHVGRQAALVKELKYAPSEGKCSLSKEIAITQSSLRLHPFRIVLPILGLGVRALWRGKLCRV
jgi:hypothetical protein